ncbi:predicted HD superfamily hydrolase [Coriobacteriaceae bacterium EMTCatB1]|nr:predicted HD superfamily hydrolase [Coriobacteriaceae bacterium EMTCatB1]
MPVVYVLVSLVLGVAIGYLAHRYFVSDAIARSRESAERLLEDAKRQAETTKKEMLLEAKDEIFRMKAQAEEENKERRKDLAALENRLMQREEALERRAETLDKREHQLSSMQGQIQKMERDLQEAIAQERERLEALAGMTTEQARQVLLERVRQDVTHDAAMIIREAETRAREEAERKARNIVSIAIQRVAADHTAESTVSVVHIPSDDLKGRLIGREGRNIRAFEQLTGINLIIDDTPEAVILSSFDPVRREIGRVTLEGLIADGRIHPARIEEMFAKATALVEQQIRDAGEAAALEVGIPNLHSDLIRTLGRLKFRTSYGQNVLKHSLEVAYLAGVIASELGVDPKVAKRAGLLHDIGKAIDHEVEGPHAVIGADLARRLGESPDVVHCIEAHHADVEPATVEAVIVQAADAVSASRPGARRETLESYIKRLEKLEKIAESHKGVEKSYAMQAGREIRVMVKPDEISDAESTVLAREIAKQIEEELQYPGQIKVMVIRESRAIEYAK